MSLLHKVRANLIYVLQSKHSFIAKHSNMLFLPVVSSGTVPRELFHVNNTIMHEQGGP